MGTFVSASLFCPVDDDKDDKKGASLQLDMEPLTCENNPPWVNQLMRRRQESFREEESVVFFCGSRDTCLVQQNGCFDEDDSGVESDSLCQEDVFCEVMPEPALGTFPSSRVRSCRVFSEDDAEEESISGQWTVDNLWRQAQDHLISPHLVEDILDDTADFLLRDYYTA